jgi:hypothetical protein
MPPARAEPKGDHGQRPGQELTVSQGLVVVFSHNQKCGGRVHLLCKGCKGLCKGAPRISNFSRPRKRATPCRAVLFYTVLLVTV